MSQFDINHFLAQLKNSTSIEECEKIPTLVKEDDTYIFISYSRKDYKAVYADLAKLYANGVRFWYDKAPNGGTTAGRRWKNEVEDRIKSPNCVGVIFYLSTDVFLSSAILDEIRYTCEAKKAYFCINLRGGSITDILRDALSQKRLHSDSVQLLTSAFSDDDTYLTYTDASYGETLINQIRILFKAIDETAPTALAAKKPTSSHRIPTRLFPVIIAIIGLFVSIFLVIHFLLPTKSFTPDTTLPSISLSETGSLSNDNGAVQLGGCLFFTLEFSDNVGISNIALAEENIILSQGLTADISIIGAGNTRTIFVYNIHGPYGTHSITVPANIVTDTSGNQSLPLPPIEFALEEIDTSIPAVTISKADPAICVEGGFVTYLVAVYDNDTISNFSISPTDIVMVGFQADITIEEVSVNVRKIILSNIKHTAHSGKNFFVLSSGVVNDASGNTNYAKASPFFTIQ